ncbi:MULTISPECIES: DUF4198 domain-containing protein [unclassified Pseudodesulfovibrio]|uniref:DUF4198 domain-containing protein n=1 Tax=unclassified Pseudodesulfovibrio TaxID=2661612 RepID=UPI000FEB641B|nr:MULTISPECIES: DUF4198 domain-containing protein [unclassified Pseudodesulfovibrio]MCJ2163357.1 DUF4198 domain-containing protein [Pseudodesulfovibrio sp. S3-i]RWU06870.1 DUF4198 domain-containing protein [Pseudodesulfovibrio sp. S3]
MEKVVAVCLVLALTLFLGGEIASAHSLYIQSGRFRVSEGKKTPLFFAYGHHFPVDDGVRFNKLAFIRVYDPTGKVTEIAPRDETCLQSHMVEYGTNGTYVLTAETNPGFYTKWVDKKGRDRNSIKPMSEVRDQASEIVKSLYSKQYAKSYVRCGEPDGKYQAHVGLPLELVPVQDPTTLKPGDTLVLKVFKGGKRYFGAGHWDATYGGYSTEAEDLYHPGAEVSGDTIRVSLDQPGRWFIRYYIKTDAVPDKKDAYLQLKQTATLVVLVPNERKPTVAEHQ